MKEILTADQMRRSDQRMIQKMQVPSLVLMERAALQCVAAMKAEDIDLSKALVVCGSGNNGGDGFAIARMLVEEGNHPDVVLVGNYDHRSEETKIQMKILENLGISVGNSLPQKEYSVIIDAVFGIGLSREIKGRYAEVIDQMNRMTACKVAVDTPSGIRSDDGKVLGTAFKADLTVTFAFQKMGQILYPGCEYTGKLVTAPIGITRPEFFAEEEICMALEKSDVPAMLPQRKPDSNKGTYGKVLIIRLIFPHFCRILFRCLCSNFCFVICQLFLSGCNALHHGFAHPARYRSTAPITIDNANHTIHFLCKPFCKIKCNR